MSAQSASTEALFLALAHIEEAARRARTIRATPARPVDITELATAMQMATEITAHLGKTVESAAQAIYHSYVHHLPPASSALAYDAARQLRALSLHHRRATRTNLDALTTFANTFPDPRTLHRRNPGETA